MDEVSIKCSQNKQILEISDACCLSGVKNNTEVIIFELAAKLLKVGLDLNIRSIYNIIPEILED